MNSFMICFNCLYQHKYIGMFAGYFFYSLPLSLYIAVTVIKFLSINTVICSSDSVTVSVQFVVALKHCNYSETTQRMVIYPLDCAIRV